MPLLSKVNQLFIWLRLLRMFQSHYLFLHNSDPLIFFLMNREEGKILKMFIFCKERVKIGQIVLKIYFVSKHWISVAMHSKMQIARLWLDFSSSLYHIHIIIISLTVVFISNAVKYSIGGRSHKQNMLLQYTDLQVQVFSKNLGMSLCKKSANVDILRRRNCFYRP